MELWTRTTRAEDEQLASHQKATAEAAKRGFIAEGMRLHRRRAVMQ